MCSTARPGGSITPSSPTAIPERPDGGGEYRPELALTATRALFGLWVLWDSPYTDALMQLGRWPRDDRRGWYEGRFERSGEYNPVMTLSTNAMVLESLLYKQNNGPLIDRLPPPGYLEASCASP
ncbi:DUF3131 domain-containing protein [Edwardsiella anguillarum]|nr:DUF3131 domain-containing protein [Edwardsiella anguillarum]